MNDNTFQVGCPSCETLFEVTDPTLIGQIVACPKCGGMMMIEPPRERVESPASVETAQKESVAVATASKERSAPLDEEEVSAPEPVANEIDGVGSGKKSRASRLVGLVGVVAVAVLGTILFSRRLATEQDAPPAAPPSADSSDVKTPDVPPVETTSDVAPADGPIVSDDELDDFHSGVNVDEEDASEGVRLDAEADSNAENGDESENEEEGQNVEAETESETIDLGVTDDELGESSDAAVALDEESGAEEPTEDDAIPTDFDEAKFERENQAAEETTESDEEDLGSVASTTDVSLQNALPVLRSKPVEIDVDARMALAIHSIVFPESPAAAIRLLSEFSGTPIEFDLERFPLIRPSLNKRLDLKLDDVDVGAALAKEAEMLKWDVVKESDRIVIEPQTSELSEFVEQRFDVADILADSTPFPIKLDPDGARMAPQPATPDALVEFVKSFVAPTEWGAGDGEGKVSVDGSELVVTHNATARKSIEILLDQLRVLRRLDSERRIATENLAPELRGWETLSKKTSFNLLKPTSLQHATAILESKFNFLALWDDSALNAVGVGRNSTTNVRIESSPVSKVLSDVLEPFRLNYVILDEKLILITTSEKADAYRTVEIHGFASLDSPKTIDEAEKLTKKMTSEVAPEGWDDPETALWLDVENGCWIVRRSQPVQRTLRAWTSALLEKEKAKKKKSKENESPKEEDDPND